MRALANWETAAFHCSARLTGSAGHVSQTIRPASTRKTGKTQGLTRLSRYNGTRTTAPISVESRMGRSVPDR